MYPPPHHQTTDKEKIISVIEYYPLATLVSVADNFPFTTQLPIVYYSETGKLVGHIDRENPQIITLFNGANVTVLFNGPSGYISPSIYTTKQLPTYNYITAKITGMIKLIDNAEEVKKSMVRMTSFLEGNNPKFELDHNDVKMDRLIHYIQTFEIEIDSFEGKFKLSQDKIEVDYENAKAALVKNATKDISGFIEKLYSSN